MRSFSLIMRLWLGAHDGVLAGSCSIPQYLRASDEVGSLPPASSKRVYYNATSGSSLSMATSLGVVVFGKTSIETVHFNCKLVITRTLMTEYSISPWL